jgi:hypothetical protein
MTTKQSEKLLPCPFCGSGASLEEVNRAIGVCWSAGCSNEECLGYQSLTAYPRKCEAVKAWNTRASDDKGLILDVRKCKKYLDTDGTLPRSPEWLSEVFGRVLSALGDNDDN